MKGQAQQRAAVLHEVAQGQLTAPAAAALLGLSERQVRRLLAAYRHTGAVALQHGHTGRQPAHTVSPAVRQQVLNLAQTTSQGCNDQHLSELLAEREGLHLSRSSVRRILLDADLAGAHSPPPARHRQRRPRYPQAGMLVQIDASPHDWLAGRGPALTLLAAIDDATNEVPAALFRLTEDAQGSFLLLERLVTSRGCPLALYHDRHSIFQVAPKQRWSVAEQLAGRQAPTPFGRLLAALGITSIAAQSPQAKGRHPQAGPRRLFGTWQDRLVAERRLAGATNLAEDAPVLGSYLPKCNERFRVPAAHAGSAYRPLDPAVRPETVFCVKYLRVVAADHTVRLGDQRLQLQPSATRFAWARAQVEVHERLDGSLAVYYQGQCVTTTAAPLEAPALRTRAGRLTNVEPPTAPPAPMDPGAPAAPAAPTPPRARKPAPNHPWRSPGLPRQRTTAPPSEEPP